MICKRMTPLMASGILVLVAALDAPAQLPGQFTPGTAPMQSGPVFSPYLNLLQRGNPAINYYGLVRPEIQFRSAVRSLANELEQTQNDVATNQSAASLTTGHPIQFFNLGHYYPGSPMGGTMGRGATGNAGAATNYLSGMQNAGMGATGMGATGMGGAGGGNRTGGAPAQGR